MFQAGIYMYMSLVPKPIESQKHYNPDLNVIGCGGG